MIIINKLKSNGNILRFGLPFIAVALMFLTISISEMSPYELAISHEYIASQLEHILTGLTLLIGGELLFDIALREAHSRGSD